MHSLVVEGVDVLAEMLSPGVAEIEIPVVLSHRHVELGPERFEKLGALGDLARLAELRQIASEEDEVGRGIQRIDIVDGSQGGPHKALVEFSLVEVRVG